MANSIVFVAGSPGAGKTTILKQIANSSKYKIVNMGSLLTEVAVKKRYIKNRDQIRFLTSSKITELRKLVLKKISEMSGNIIVDSHASVEQNGRYVPGLSIEDFKFVKFSAFIYIDALTTDIRTRRSLDKSRKREKEREELIDVQRLINVSVLSTAAAYLNKPIYVVFNKQGSLRASLIELRGYLEDVFGNKK